MPTVSEMKFSAVLAELLPTTASTDVFDLGAGYAIRNRDDADGLTFTDASRVYDIFDKNHPDGFLYKVVVDKDGNRTFYQPGLFRGVAKIYVEGLRTGLPGNVSQYQNIEASCRNILERKRTFEAAKANLEKSTATIAVATDANGIITSILADLIKKNWALNQQAILNAAVDGNELTPYHSKEGTGFIYPDTETKQTRFVFVGTDGVLKFGYIDPEKAGYDQKVLQKATDLTEQQLEDLGNIFSVTRQQFNAQVAGLKDNQQGAIYSGAGKAKAWYDVERIDETCATQNRDSLFQRLAVLKLEKVDDEFEFPDKTKVKKIADGYEFSYPAPTVEKPDAVTAVVLKPGDAAPYPVTHYLAYTKLALALNAQVAEEVRLKNELAQRIISKYSFSASRTRTQLIRALAAIYAKNGNQIPDTVRYGVGEKAADGSIQEGLIFTSTVDDSEETYIGIKTEQVEKRLPFTTGTKEKISLIIPTKEKLTAEKITEIFSLRKAYQSAMKGVLDSSRGYSKEPLKFRTKVRFTDDIGHNSEQELQCEIAVTSGKRVLFIKRANAGKDDLPLFAITEDGKQALPVKKGNERASALRHGQILSGYNYPLTFETSDQVKRDFSDFNRDGEPLRRIFDRAFAEILLQEVKDAAIIDQANYLRAKEKNDRREKREEARKENRLAAVVQVKEYASDSREVDLSDVEEAKKYLQEKHPTLANEEFKVLAVLEPNVEFVVGKFVAKLDKDTNCFVVKSSSVGGYESPTQEQQEAISKRLAEVQKTLTAQNRDALFQRLADLHLEVDKELEFSDKTKVKKIAEGYEFTYADSSISSKTITLELGETLSFENHEVYEKLGKALDARDQTIKDRDDLIHRLISNHSSSVGLGNELANVLAAVYKENLGVVPASIEYKKYEKGGVTTECLVFTVGGEKKFVGIETKQVELSDAEKTKGVSKTKTEISVVSGAFEESSGELTKDDSIKSDDLRKAFSVAQKRANFMYNFFATDAEVVAGRSHFEGELVWEVKNSEGKEFECKIYYHDQYRNEGILCINEKGRDYPKFAFDKEGNLKRLDEPRTEGGKAVISDADKKFIDEFRGFAIKQDAILAAAIVARTQQVLEAVEVDGLYVEKAVELTVVEKFCDVDNEWKDREVFKYQLKGDGSFAVQEGSDWKPATFKQLTLIESSLKKIREESKDKTFQMVVDSGLMKRLEDGAKDKEFKGLQVADNISLSLSGKTVVFTITDEKDVTKKTIATFGKYSSDIKQENGGVITDEAILRQTLTQAIACETKFEEIDRAKPSQQQRDLVAKILKYDASGIEAKSEREAFDAFKEILKAHEEKLAKAEGMTGVGVAKRNFPQWSGRDLPLPQGVKFYEDEAGRQLFHLGGDLVVGFDKDGKAVFGRATFNDELKISEIEAVKDAVDLKKFAPQESAKEAVDDKSFGKVLTELSTGFGSETVTFNLNEQYAVRPGSSKDHEKFKDADVFVVVDRQKSSSKDKKDADYLYKVVVDKDGKSTFYQPGLISGDREIVLTSRPEFLGKAVESLTGIEGAFESQYAKIESLSRNALEKRKTFAEIMESAKVVEASHSDKNKNIRYDALVELIQKGDFLQTAMNQQHVELSPLHYQKDSVTHVGFSYYDDEKGTSKKRFVYVEKETGVLKFGYIDGKESHLQTAGELNSRELENLCKFFSITTQQFNSKVSELRKTGTYEAEEIDTAASTPCPSPRNAKAEPLLAVVKRAFKDDKEVKDIIEAAMIVAANEAGLSRETALQVTKLIKEVYKKTGRGPSDYESDSLSVGEAKVIGGFVAEVGKIEKVASGAKVCLADVQKFAEEFAKVLDGTGLKTNANGDYYSKNPMKIFGVPENLVGKLEKEWGKDSASFGAKIEDTDKDVSSKKITDHKTDKASELKGVASLRYYQGSEGR